MLTLDLPSRAGRAAVRREGDGDLRQEPLELQRVRSLAERDGLRRGVVRRVVHRVRRRGEHRLVALVVRLEVVVGDGPVLPASVIQVFADEGRRVLAEEHVRVQQRAAAEPARDDPAEPAELPHVEQPVQALARIPEVVARPPRATRERAGRVCLATFEEAHAHARFPEPQRSHRPSEPGADDHGVEVLVAHGFLSSPPAAWWTPTRSGRPRRCRPQLESRSAGSRAAAGGRTRRSACVR